MITASITIHGQHEKRIEILQTMKGLKDQLARDTRCKQVDIYQDIDDKNTFFLVEEWLTGHDLDDYLSSRLFKILLGIAPILKEPLEIKLLTEMTDQDSRRITSLKQLTTLHGRDDCEKT